LIDEKQSINSLFDYFFTFCFVLLPPSENTNHLNMAFEYPLVLDGGGATELEASFGKDLSGRTPQLRIHAMNTRIDISL
jgi:hypothetical protein